MNQIILKTIRPPVKSQRSSSNPPSGTRIVEVLQSLYKKQDSSVAESLSRKKANIVHYENQLSIRNESKPKPRVEKLDMSESSIHPARRTQASYRVRPSKVIHEYDKEKQKSQLINSSMSRDQETLPVCLTGVVDPAIKIKKLEKKIEEMKTELNNMNVNMKIFYTIGMIDEKVYNLCQEKDLKLVMDQNILAPTQIYADNIPYMVNQISNKVIKYHSTKQQLKCLLQKTQDINCHLDHAIPEKLRRQTKFPISFNKQLKRIPYFVNHKEDEKDHSRSVGASSLKSSKRKNIRQSFQDDKLRWTHNFDSYTKRGFESSRYQQTLNSSFLDSRS